jgi:antitoxin component YwqK of YwqJK toxin-antitoxin module
MTVKDFNDYDCIFIGTLIRETAPKYDTVTDYDLRRTSTYKITRAYKGTMVGDTIQIYDAHDGAACGLGRLSIGRQYLIYSFGDSLKITGDCLRTTRVPIQYWPKDSASINKMKNLSLFGRIYDTARSNFHADTVFLNSHITRVQHSSVQRFYDEGGKVLAEGRYNNGVQDGFWKYFNGDKVVASGKYINGKQDSIWVETGSYSSDIKYVREYRNNNFTGKEKCYYNDVLRDKTEPVGDGRKWIDVNYHSNGKVKSIHYAHPPLQNRRGYWESPEPDGESKFFNEEGVLLEEGYYKDGQRVGRWKYYYQDGLLRMQGDYLNSEKSGVWKIYYRHKQIKAQGEYRNGEKTGNWKYYDELGNQILPDPKLIEEDEELLTYYL